MKRILLVVVASGIFIACGNGGENSPGADTTVSSTTPPDKPDTNSIGIMMGDTSIGINDSLTIDSVKK